MSFHSMAYRREEIECVRHLFISGARVLEIGGGNGFQAFRINSWGCEVESIDVSGPALGEQIYFPIKLYDGIHLPYGDNTFDIVFTSNVLEHVKHLSPLLSETRRVMRVGARAIHILPTPCWRLWTSLTYFVDVLRRIRRV